MCLFADGASPVLMHPTVSPILLHFLYRDILPSNDLITLQSKATSEGGQGCEVNDSLAR